MDSHCFQGSGQSLLTGPAWDGASLRLSASSFREALSACTLLGLLLQVEAVPALAIRVLTDCVMQFVHGTNTQEGMHLWPWCFEDSLPCSPSALPQPSLERLPNQNTTCMFAYCRPVMAILSQ